MTELRVMDRRRLRAQATPDARRAQEVWQTSLARSAEAPPPLPLVSLLEDWAEFSELDYRDMLAVISRAQHKADREWADWQPQSDDEVAAFYDRSDTIVPLLLWWHATGRLPALCATAAAQVFERVGARRVLDFGAGIGSTALVFARRGIDVVMADVAREPLRFAEWRLKARGYTSEPLDLVASSLDDLPTASVDGVVTFDTFEHLPDSAASVGALDRVLRPGGALVFNQAYVPEESVDQHYPQRGQVLVALHERGYRLAHVASVAWVAQKAPLSPVGRRAQGLEIRARIAAVRAMERRRGAVGSRLSFHTIRHALS